MGFGKKNLIITLLIITGFLVYSGPNYSYTMSETPASVYSGTYINESIKAPLTQIGIPDEYLEPQVEEQGLEIEWNEWHARVRNKIMNDMLHTNYISKSLYYFIYTVHKNGEISNIITAQFVEDDSEFYKITINNHEKPRFDYEYAVSMKKESDNNYKTYIYNIGNYNLSTKDGVLIDALKQKRNKKNATLFDRPYATKQMAKQIEKAAKSPVLNFPAKSKRDKVVVYQTITIDLDIPEVKTQNKSSDVNDIETLK